MIILIAGASHTGKTFLAQKLLEHYHYPYLSIDHLKMGLIRSGQTRLTPLDDEKLVGHLWPILREIIKTAIENKQNLIIEGCYIPHAWKESFSEDYLESIEYYCLVMTENYIQTHLSSIRQHASVIEDRRYDSASNKNRLIKENMRNLAECKEYDNRFVLIDEDFVGDLARHFPFIKNCRNKVLWKGKEKWLSGYREI